MPSLNPTPRMTWVRRPGPLVLRHLPLADIIGLKTLAGAVLRLGQAPVFPVWPRAVAKTLPVGFAVPIRFQHRAGKSWKAIGPSRSLTGFSAALPHFTPQVSARMSGAASVSLPVPAIRMFRRSALALSCGDLGIAPSTLAVP